ncbi:MAG: hypothetical protein EOO63_15345 [Hymenobacter sp.]|nr:MAG: hypothetical protein EOO63_15345 [Hymenobacter sp.]
MRSLLLLAAGLWLGSLTGCKDETPQIACYSGTVIGTTCMDGVLIEVSSATPIGRPVRVYQTYRDSIVGTNVVAAINDLGSLAQKGQTVFFTYQDSPNNQGPLHFCPQNTGKLPIPHLLLANISATSCAGE